MQKQVVAGTNYIFTLNTGKCFKVYCGLPMTSECADPVQCPAAFSADYEIPTAVNHAKSENIIDARALTAMDSMLAYDPSDIIISIEVSYI